MPRYKFHSGKVTVSGLQTDKKSDFKGRQIVKYSAASGTTYTVAEEDYLIGVTASATTACTITIPTDLLESGRILIIDDTGGDSSSQNITIGTEGSETIDGSATATISTNYGSLGLYSNGSNWFSF